MKLKFKIVSGEPNITTMQQLQTYCNKKRKAAIFHHGKLCGIVERDFNLDYKRD